MFNSAHQILEALRLTGRRLALADGDEHSILVCGGSALNLLGILVRPTRDVDVLGMVIGTKARLIANRTIPDDLRQAAEQVA